MENETHATMIVALTPELIGYLELILAAVYVESLTHIPEDEEFYNGVLDAHDAWAAICQEAGGEVDRIDDSWYM